MKKRAKIIEAKAKAKARVSNEVKLDPVNPIPFNFKGDSFYFFEADTRYIPFLDQNDNFFNVLLEARLLSPTQGACINTKGFYFIGNGITVDELKDDVKLKDFDPELYAFSRSSNNYGETLNTVISDINEHLDTFGNCWVEIVKGAAGTKKFVKVYVWNTPECRLAMKKGESDPTMVLKSSRFLGTGMLGSIDDVVSRPLLDRTNPLDRNRWKSEKGTERTVLHIKTKKAGYPHYGMPKSIESLHHQLIEYKGSRYNVDNFENNLSMGGFLGLKGSFSPTEVTNKARSINKQYVGPGKAGRWIVIGSEEGIDGIDVKPFNTQREGSYIDLDNKAESKILFSHQWNKVLAGMDDGSALGKGNSYLKSVFDAALKTVIIPRQQFILENFIEPLTVISDDWLGTKWNSYDWKFKNATPVSFISLIKNIDSAVKRNEVREELGLMTDDSPAGDEYLSSGGSSNFAKDQKQEVEDDSSK